MLLKTVNQLMPYLSLLKKWELRCLTLWELFCIRDSTKEVKHCVVVVATQYAKFSHKTGIHLSVNNILVCRNLLQNLVTQSGTSYVLVPHQLKCKTFIVPLHSIKCNPIAVIIPVVTWLTNRAASLIRCKGVKTPVSPVVM